MKLVSIIAAFIFLVAGGFYFYSEQCKRSPECACKNAAPGDPTCMSVEQLNQWCATKDDIKAFPQCNLAPNSN